MIGTFCWLQDRVLGAELLQQAELQGDDGGSDSGSELELEDGEDVVSDEGVGPAEEGAPEMPAARQAETAERPNDDGLDSDGEAVLEVRSEVSHQRPVAHVLRRILLSLCGLVRAIAVGVHLFQSSPCFIDLMQEFSTSIMS